MIEEIRELVANLEDVQSHLARDKHKKIPPIPRMYPDEMPEKYVILCVQMSQSCISIETDSITTFIYHTVCLLIDIPGHV